MACGGARTRCQTQVSSRAAASSRRPIARSGARFFSPLSSGGARFTRSSGFSSRVPMLSPSSCARQGCSDHNSALENEVRSVSQVHALRRDAHSMVDLCTV